MRKVGSKRRLAVALVALMALLAGITAWFSLTSAQAQLATDFELSIGSGGLPTSGGAEEVTLSLSPGDSAVAAVGATVTYDASLVSPTACTALVGLGACNTDTAGQVVVQTVDPAGWSTATDLFRITFTGVALTDTAALTVTVTEAYDVSGTLIAGEVLDGSIDFRLNGDVNCSGSRNVADALIIAQYSVSLRTAGMCPLSDPGTMIDLTNADVTGDDRVNTIDALRVAQCTVNIFDCDQ